MVNLKKINEFTWRIEKTGNMLVPVEIFASGKLIESIKSDKTLDQAINMACLPGVTEKIVVCPDAHQGYGACIGGVSAHNTKDGVISPGEIGYDINCGVRLLRTNITKEDFLEKKDEICSEINKTIPSGVGFENKEKLSDEELNNYLEKGSTYALEKKLATKDDLMHTEEEGHMRNTNTNYVSERAKARGKGQLGTLGAGNHFLEFQIIDEIIDKKRAKSWNLNMGDICVMIHCGSRGLGHQIASDYIKLMEKEYGHENLPDRELIHAPINSELGQKYIGAMNCAINFAFANRQIIMHQVREILNKFFPENENHLVYDVAHNIAKFEEHIINKEKKEVCIHRKGATRAFENQPVIIPGSMGTASYILVGTKEAESISFGSTAHGAGRIMSRSRAISTIDPEKTKNKLEKKGISVYSRTKKGISEEAPEVYKDIEEVVNVSDSLGIAKKVVRLKPLAVIKG